ncbi:MAG: hypothetical protein AB1649_20350 [Chloroflexota bacterium]
MTSLITMATLKSVKDESVATGARKSSRFSPSAFTEKFVPVLLILLLIVLVVVLVIIGLSLFGVTPAA